MAILVNEADVPLKNELKNETSMYFNLLDLNPFFDGSFGVR